jgi:hypothetical protein
VSEYGKLVAPAWREGRCGGTESRAQAESRDSAAPEGLGPRRHAPCSTKQLTEDGGAGYNQQGSIREDAECAEEL